MSDYKYAGNGTYQKVSDGSSPYGKDENGDFYLIGKSSGGGGSPAVLDTVINNFDLNTDVPAVGDTLQVTLDKLYTVKQNFNQEVLNSKLYNLSVLDSTDIRSTDTVIIALGKLQAEITNLRRINNEQNEILAGLTLRVDALEGK